MKVIPSNVPEGPSQCSRQDHTMIKWPKLLCKQMPYSFSQRELSHKRLWATWKMLFWFICPPICHTYLKMYNSHFEINHCLSAGLKITMVQYWGCWYYRRYNLFRWVHKYSYPKLITWWSSREFENHVPWNLSLSSRLSNLLTCNCSYGFIGSFKIPLKGISVVPAILLPF